MLPYLGILGLILLSGFFSGSEIAFTSVNELRLRKAADAGEPDAQRAQKILEDYDSALSTILIGNNLVNIGASSLAAMIALALGGDAAVGVSSVLITILILTLGEILPKILAKQQSERFARLASLPLGILMLLFRPLIYGIVKLVNRIARLWEDGAPKKATITEEELTEILNTVEDEGVLDEDKSDLLQSALEFDELTADDALTPRVDMVSIDLDDAMEETLGTVLDCGFSRIPAYRDTVDNIVGILPVNHFLQEMASQGTCDIEALLQTPLFVHQAMKLDDVLKTMREKRTHIAIVLDEYGGTQGMVTMEDVLEQLVGEIWDEKDDIVEECQKVAEGEYVCSGLMSLHDFFDEIDFDERDFSSEYTTLGGWAVEMLDAQPEVGARFTYENLTVTVLKMDGLRVDSLRVQVAERPEETIEP